MKINLGELWKNWISQRGKLKRCWNQKIWMDVRGKYVCTIIRVFRYIWFIQINKVSHLQFTYRIVRFKGAQQGRVYHQCAVVNNRLYVIGGGRPNHLAHLAANTVAIYDISSNQWYTGPSMRSYRQQYVFFCFVLSYSY